ncbi:MAG: hypothetical protein Q8O40_15235 [Chloroflexota bacterium]|nr:hypothetical protein [Chloroflexota bacterium]
MALINAHGWEALEVKTVVLPPGEEVVIHPAPAAQMDQLPVLRGPGGRALELLAKAAGHRVVFYKDNPLVRLSLHFRDGVELGQNFDPPVPQAKAMRALGHLVAELGAKLEIDLGDDVLTEEPRHAQEVCLGTDSGAGSGQEGADGGVAARLGAAGVSGAS